MINNSSENCWHDRFWVDLKSTAVNINWIRKLIIELTYSNWTPSVTSIIWDTIAQDEYIVLKWRDNITAIWKLYEFTRLLLYFQHLSFKETWRIVPRLLTHWRSGKCKHRSEVGDIRIIHRANGNCVKNLIFFKELLTIKHTATKHSGIMYSSSRKE